MSYPHVSVMVDEVCHYINCRPGKIFADCTLGGAGHTQAICQKIVPRGVVIGIDQDRAAIRHAHRVLAPYDVSKYLFCENFVRFPDILDRLGIAAVDGILLDLGISLYHLKNSGRGFSFSRDEPLDMRMDTRSDVTAGQLIHALSESELQKLFKTYGDIRWSVKLARRIVRERERGEIKTSKQLADIIKKAAPAAAMKKGRHPATQAFMALRIAVNKELDRLKRFMDFAVDFLNPGGRLCVLAFHSLEDRIVKKRFKLLEGVCICPPGFPKCVCHPQKVARVLTRRVVRPTPAEVSVNPMARSTRLRAIEKC